MRHRSHPLGPPTVALALTVLAGQPADAGGFQLNERSTKALGAALSGSVSAASDVTFASFNPAALSRVEGFEIGGNLSAVLPSSEGRFTTGPATGFEFDSGQGAAVPGFAGGARVNEFVTVGLASYSPFGLVTDHPQDFPGAADATRSSLTAIQVSPMVAFDISDTLSIGVAADILYADATLKSAIVQLDGDGFEVGFSGGLLWEPVETTRIGFAYHSGFDLEIDGSQRNLLLGGVTAPLASSASLPPWLQVGVTQQVTEDLTVMGEFRYINWKDFDSLDFSSPALAGTPFANFSEEQNYEDAFFFSLGGEYALDEAVTLRGGIAYDETPTTDAFRTARVPDGDRLWLSAGASYALTGSMTLDFAYNYLQVIEDPTVRLRNGALAGSEISFDGSVHIVSIGGTLRF